MYLTLWRGLARAARLAAPSLRVIALTYTGLSGMLALLVVVGVALTPVAPGLQQVTQPARDAVGTLVQPTGLAVANLLGTAQAPGVPAAAPVLVTPPIALGETLQAPADDSQGDDWSAEDALADGPALDDAPVDPGRPAVGVLVVGTPRVFQAAPVASAIEDVPVLDDDAGIDESLPAPLDALDAVVAEPVTTLPGLQIASEDAPRPLPPVAPVVPQTQAQIKASLDRANQTAIDAARSAQVRARADANAANDVAQANAANAAAQADAAMSSAPATAQPNDPSPGPVINEGNAASPASAGSAPGPTAPAPTAPMKTAADTANQAAIDAARATAASDKAQANAANQAAQDAARAAQPKKP